MSLEPTRKYMASGNGRGKAVPVSCIGTFYDGDGQNWAVWRSTINDLSAMRRLEPMGGTRYKRARFLYDPGCHWSGTYVKPRA